jgi:hypothetical protein
MKSTSGQQKNFLNINVNKTKEMLISSLHCEFIEPLKLNNTEIQSVSSFKLLGVHIDFNLKWNTHIDAICSKANSRVYFIKYLKRCAVQVDDLLYYYYSYVRPVLEYACPTWHTCLTREQSDRLELVQKMALSIVFSMSVYEYYLQLCSINNIATLANRREELCTLFFMKSVVNENGCLHYLLPTSKDISIANKLRNRPKYYNVNASTTRFMNSFLMYGLRNFLESP